MNIIKKIILSQILFLSCKDPKLNFLNDIEIKNNKQFVESLKNFVPAEIELPENLSVQFLDFGPTAVSKKNITLNSFNLNYYKNLGDEENLNEYYSYLLEGEKQVFLISEYLGFFVCCEKDKDQKFIIPKEVYFKLQSNEFLHMNITYNRDNTIKFSLGKSYITVSNFIDNSIKSNAFILDKSSVNLEELSNIASNLSSTTALPFIKYFYDFLAVKNGVNIVYSDENYFNHKFNILNEKYFSVTDTYNVIKNKIEKLQTLVKNIKNREKNNFYITKVFLDFPYRGMDVKHIILLIFYNERWFIVDSNGGDPTYLTENFSKTLKDLGIKFCNNNKFYNGRENSCDTFASVFSWLLSCSKKSCYKNLLLKKDDSDFDFKFLLNEWSKLGVMKYTANFVAER